MKIRSNGERLLFMASPHQFAATNLARLGDIHWTAWGQNSHALTFSRQAPLSNDQLAMIDVHFQRCVSKEISSI